MFTERDYTIERRWLVEQEHTKNLLDNQMQKSASQKKTGWDNLDQITLIILVLCIVLVVTLVVLHLKC